jgi:hypothetical protein
MTLRPPGAHRLTFLVEDPHATIASYTAGVVHPGIEQRRTGSALDRPTSSP